MVDTQHFCLRWNNYQSSITSAFENLRDDEDFVDVTLACDGRSLKAHRVVLSACSPYFRELLKSTPCKHPVIVLQDVAFSDLHALVEFIYHGEVNVHQRSLSSFLKTAEVLRVSGLTQQADQTDRDELSHVRALAAGGNHLPFHEKLEESFPRGGSPPTPVTPTPTTVQQLLRRAQIRRNERRTPDPHDETAKKPRVLSPPLNNNDATPTDFSMGVKNNHVSSKVEGNGVHEENSPLEDNIKCEPLELTGGNSGNAAGNNEDSSDSGAAASDRPPASASSNEHEAESEHTSTPNFLSETKIFPPTPGSFNFSMAALATEHTPLSGMGHGLQPPDLAGTSQVTYHILERKKKKKERKITTTIHTPRYTYAGIYVIIYFASLPPATTPPPKPRSCSTHPNLFFSFFKLCKSRMHCVVTPVSFSWKVSYVDTTRMFTPCIDGEKNKIIIKRKKSNESLDDEISIRFRDLIAVSVSRNEFATCSLLFDPPLSTS
ncbi:broad-complex core protein isoforms 1/2/3/4/5 isoform X4 [Apis cerana]|uniref:broad-complex core protein isoforms 1/2/3/4/5 isoform X4 n=1 Tax=Apis cerana TaxID=7461 RepID=UPI002B23B0A7|nr:broad-complex core protein isoforms 1/2/3/4/5 isoform X4 [Apis cerana]